MPKPKLLPSDFYPDYFRTDLGISSDKVAPLSAFLDQCLENGFEHLSLQHLAYASGSLKAEAKCNILILLGFSVGEFSPYQIDALFDGHPDLLANRGRLSAIRQLALIHFGICEVGKGNNHRTQLLKTGSFYLKDTKAKKNELFVRLSKSQPGPLVDSFLNNAALLLPKGIQTRVLSPMREPKPISPKFHLNTPIRLERGRL